jgi:predicted transcriptional regulator
MDANLLIGGGGLLLGFGSLIVAVIAINKRTEVKVTPNPLHVKEAESYVAKPEFEKHVTLNNQDHRDLFSKVGGVERGAASKLSEELKTLREERREDTDALHNKINKVDREVGELKAATNLQNQTLAGLNSDIKRILGRLPRSPSEGA